jgi:transposase
VLALVSALEPVVARISELTIQIRHALQAHPDGQTFRSLFISQDSWLCAAAMLAEIGDSRQRYPTYRALAADAGQCPVAVESGKSKHAQFRWACDHRLRDAFATLADSSRHHNPWAADIYQRARARRRQPHPRHPHPRPRLEPSHLAPLATTTPTTHSNTPPCNASSQPEVDTGGLQPPLSSRARGWCSHPAIQQ